MKATIIGTRRQVNHRPGKVSYKAFGEIVRDDSPWKTGNLYKGRSPRNAGGDKNLVMVPA